MQRPGWSCPKHSTKQVQNKGNKEDSKAEVCEVITLSPLAAEPLHL